MGLYHALKVRIVPKPFPQINVFAVVTEADGQYLTPPAVAFSPGDSLASLHSQRSNHALSMISGPPAYEILASANPYPDSAPPSVSRFTASATKRAPTDSSSAHPHPGSAPPAVSQFTASATGIPPIRASPDITLTPQPRYTRDGSDVSSPSSPSDSFDEGLSPMFNNSLNLHSPETPNSPWSIDRRLAPSPSVRTSSSGAFFSRKYSPELNDSRRFLPLSQLRVPRSSESPNEYWDDWGRVGSVWG